VTFKPLVLLLIAQAFIFYGNAQQLIAYAGPDTTICIGGESDSVDIEFGPINTATGGTAPYTYRWYTDHTNGRISSDFIYDSTAQDPTLIFIELEEFPRTFYVEVTDDSGATAMDSMQFISCGNLPVPLGCAGIYVTEGDTITLDMVSGFTCSDSIEWFPKDHIISSTNGSSIQVLVSDPDFNYNGYYAVLKSDDGCESASSHTCPFVADVFPLGIENNPTTSFNIFPNPSKGEISISASERILAITLRDCLGTEIESFDVQSYDWNHKFKLPKGLYLIEVTGESSHIHQKLLFN
jgi:hypothetical protein